MRLPLYLLYLPSLVLLSGCLLGCGGGGGGSASSPSAPTPPSLNAPTITISSPAANTTTSSTISLSGACTASVSTVDISGASPASTSCAANGTYSVSITLSAPASSKTVTVSQTNSEGTGTDSRIFILNPLVPSILITSPAASTVTASTITIQGSCDNSVSTINISGATPTSTTCSSGTFSQVITLSGVDGSKTPTLSQTNGSGTGSDNRTFILDATAPTSTSISINSGATYINSTSATLTLAATDANSGIQMYITNTAGCGSGGTYEAYSTSKSWTLAQTNSTAIAYAKFKDSIGNQSSCISTSVVHDSTSPTTITFLAPTSAVITTQSSYDFSWNASTDGGSGLKDYLVEIYSDGTCSSVISSLYQAGISYSLSTLASVNSIRVTPRDNALNIGVAACSSSITKVNSGDLDTTFGTSGVVTETVAQTTTNLALLVDSSDKIFVGADSGVFKYLSAGGRDTSFATTGFKSLSSYYTSFSINDINADSSGNVYAVGSNPSGSDGYSDVGVVSLASDGSTNTGFFSGTGKNQMDTFTSQNSSETGYKSVFISGVGLLIATNTQIVAGSAYLGYSNFKADGSFGNMTGGYSTTSPFTGNAYGVGIAYSSSVGTFLVVGQNNNNFAIAFGDVSNTTFSAGSYKYTTDFGGSDMATDALFYGSNKWLVCGTSYSSVSGQYSLALARYAGTDGSLDTIVFGSGTGKVMQTISSTNFVPSCAIDSVGNIYSSGLINNNAFIIKFQPNGTLDTSFGVNGIQTYSLGFTAWNSRLQIDSTGKIILAVYLNQAGTKQVKILKIYK